MKNLFRKLCLSAFVAVTCCACLAACGGGNGGEKTYAELSLEDYKAYIAYDLENVVKSVAGQVTVEQKAAIDKVAQEGAQAIEAADSVAAVKEAFAAAKVAIAAEVPLASGIFNYTGLSSEEKTTILGVLESYAVRNGITGISLFENGGYVMYNPRVVLGTENYIVGYGFGLLAEGHLSAELASESNAAWKMYLHSVNASDPGTANYLNDKGSEVSDFYGYIGASFYTTFMNSTKDGYDWVPELAKEMPVAVNPAENGTATTWKFHVRTGADGLKYTTNSTIASRAAFNNREVALEDYLTPFKLLLTQSNGLYRGSELANSTTGAIKGAKTYYDATASGEADFSQVGLSVGTDEGGAYFQVEFEQSLTQFNAMYYIASSLYMPIPQEFLDLVTVANYLGYNADKTETPVDNSLVVGPYALERWDSGQQVVYKKNPNYVFADTKYQIAGIHLNILTAAQTDPEAVFNQFIAGNIDSTGIPQTKLSEYKNDSRTKTTKGDSNFKLNVNATDAETWEYLWGEKGVVTQTPKDQYWQVEPALSNAHFVKALSLSINRLEFSSARGSVPSVDYLASNYMSDPEKNISYSSTQQHKEAVAALLENTDGYGYNLELAREYFKVAIAELEAEGKYQPGTKENPTVIELEVAWMYPQHEENYHKEIEQYFENAFNHASVSNGKYKLDVKFWVGNKWNDVYYNKMMVGQFDLGFGSISGNPLNPLDFVSVLSSDQSISNGFTLNWGTDTNDPEADIIVYKGLRWSYDALWQAGNGNAVVMNGVNTPSYVHELTSHKANEDGSYTSTIEFTFTLPEKTKFSVDKVVVCWYEGDYKEEAVKFAVSEMVDGKVVVTLTTSAEQVAAYPGEMGFDVYFTIQLGEGVAQSYASVYGSFPAVEAE